MVEERGTLAGLRQALRETRRERGRAAPTGEELHVLGCPFASTIYRGRGRAAPPPRVSTLGVAAAPIPIWGGGQVGGEAGAPGMGLRAHLPLGFAPSPLLGAWAMVGGALAHLGAGAFSHLAHVCLWGPCPPGGPPDPSGGPGTLPINPETFPVTKTGLPIYKSLPSDHSGTPRDVRDLIPDSEQHSVTTYIYSL